MYTTRYTIYDLENSISADSACLFKRIVNCHRHNSDGPVLNLLSLSDTTLGRSHDYPVTRETTHKYIGI